MFLPFPFGFGIALTAHRTSARPRATCGLYTITLNAKIPSQYAFSGHVNSTGADGAPRAAASALSALLALVLSSGAGAEGPAASAHVDTASSSMAFDSASASAAAAPSLSSDSSSSELSPSQGVPNDCAATAACSAVPPSVRTARAARFACRSLRAASRVMYAFFSIPRRRADAGASGFGGRRRGIIIMDGGPARARIASRVTAMASASSASASSSLPPHVATRIRHAFPRSPVATLCEMNMRSDTVKQWLTGLGARTAARHRGIVFSDNISTHQHGPEDTLFTVGEWTILASPRSVARRMLRREPCHIVLVDMNGDAAAQRVSMQLDLEHQMALTSFRKGSLFVMHGRRKCSEPKAYKYEGTGRLREQCWQEKWERMVQRGDLRDTQCELHDDELWCSGFSDVPSLCTDRTPLLDASRDVSASIVNLTNGERPRPCYAIHATVSGDLQCRTKYALRYFSVIPCGPEGAPAQKLCLLFKDRLNENWVAGLESSDEGRSFVGSPALVMPSDAKGTLSSGAVLTHNYAIMRRRRSTVGSAGSSKYFIVGGTHRSRVQRLKHNGLWMAEGQSWRWSDDLQTELLHRVYVGQGNFAPLALPRQTQWQRWRLIVDGFQTGCVENRSKAVYKQLVGAGVCEFDGRVSLAELGSKLLLYVRANTAPLGGGRHVQVTTSMDGGQRWSPFRLLDVVGLPPHSGEVYYWSAQRNPAHGDTLLAVAPIVHHGRGCVGLSLSVDGHTWSTPEPLVRCGVHGERTVDHPVAGVVATREGSVLFFVHREVPLISQDKRGASTVVYAPPRACPASHCLHRPRGLIPSRTQRDRTLTSALERFSFSQRRFGWRATCCAVTSSEARPFGATRCHVRSSPTGRRGTWRSSRTTASRARARSRARTCGAGELNIRQRARRHIHVYNR